MDNLDDFIAHKFGVVRELFLDALKLSPNAQGYLMGAITEFTLRDYLTEKGYEVVRIKEKWEGTKHANHHGDFYIRKKGTQPWFVLESKGVKTNSEKWHKLYNKASLQKFLEKYMALTPFTNAGEISDYIDNHLPRFKGEYANDFYTLNEVRTYAGTAVTAKSLVIKQLKELAQEAYEKLSVERIGYVRSAVNVIETHLVSGGSNRSLRTQATPRNDEFHILSLDLFLRTGKHEFVFVNPKDLEPSGQDRNHLQQNYILDVLLKDVKDRPTVGKPWSSDIDTVYATLVDPVREQDMQPDHRSIEEISQAAEIA